MFAALDHAARRQILLTVHFRGAMTAGQIAGRFAHAWPTTTRHMRVLEAAGLLAHEKRGRERVYRVNRDRLDVLREWLAWFYRDPAPARADATADDAAAKSAETSARAEGGTRAEGAKRPRARRRRTA